MSLFKDILISDRDKNKNKLKPNKNLLKVNDQDISTLSISSLSDYHIFEFPGKELQREEVIDILDKQGFIPDDLIEIEVDWFYNELGIDDLFFSREQPKLLSNIINSLYAAKLNSFAEKKFNLNNNHSHPHFLVPTTPPIEKVQEQIEKLQISRTGRNSNNRNGRNISNDRINRNISNERSIRNISNERVNNNMMGKEREPETKRHEDINNFINIKNRIFNQNGNAIFMESMDDVNMTYQLDIDIDNMFLDKTNIKDCNEHNYRLVSFFAPMTNLKLSFIYNCNFPKVSKKKFITQQNLLNGDIEPICDKTLWQILSIENKKLYGLLIKLVNEREGPIIKRTRSINDPNEIRFLIAYKSSTTMHYYFALNSLFHYYKLKPLKFYVETFNLANLLSKNFTENNLDIDDSLTNHLADNITIFSIYLNEKQQEEVLGANELEIYLRQIQRESSLLYAIPNNSFIKVYQQRQFSPQEAVYAHISSIFINHFINRLGADYSNLISQLNLDNTNNNNNNILNFSNLSRARSNSNNGANKKVADNRSNITLLEIMENLKKKLRTETFTEKLIINSLEKHYKIVSKLYKNFAEVHYIHNSENDKLEKTLSYKRLSKLEPFQNDQEFEAYLNKFIPNDSPDYLILKTLNIFNKSILKTNFFMERKVAISFRLNPELIMPLNEYPELPYGIFLVVGNTFQGFHIRFRDIARGGIRIVTSKTQDMFDLNSRTIIDENYNLALTQQRKNKDIPEGGSKGVLLINPGITDVSRTFVAFAQYIDSLIDILIKDPLKDNYIDLLGTEEILFLGPDEGSAKFVNWATNHARKRNCSWWKSFITGKEQKLGGIPHDKYGMTSIGVRAYVNKIYETLHLTNETIYKFQTGGPDGDLGSNEILLSTDNEVYMGISDGSGVICDPKGINKLELQRLARARKLVMNFDPSKLSKAGFMVSVDDRDIMLPNGAIISNGTTFRNIFHLEIFKFVDRVDIFVPCGGRPNSINLNNLHYFIDEKTEKVKIPYIVEGANLFISQPAKLELEKHGCILFKDASANKGGVTSSSLEVLASLALNDDDFLNKFIDTKRTNSEDEEKDEREQENGKDDKDECQVSELYQQYVTEVQRVITKNAQLEFNQLWQLNRDYGVPISDLSNILSTTINKLTDDLRDSEELWLNDIKLRNHLLIDKIIPKILTDIAGPDKIVDNIPEPYLNVMLSSYLASSFVYQYGIDINIGTFLEYIGELRRGANLT